MILAAGKGTRLKPLTDVTPKPMLTLGGRPLIQWQVEALARAGVERVVINLHHLGDQIEAHLGDGSAFGVEVTYSREPQLLETGGGIVQALPLLGDEPFVLLNGDIWTDFDFTALPQSPTPPDLAHIVLTDTPVSRSAGDFEFANGRVTARGQDYVYCGIAVLSPALFEGVDLAHFSLRDLYFELIKNGRLSAQLHQGIWRDIGTVSEYQTLAEEISRAAG